MEMYLPYNLAMAYIPLALAIGIMITSNVYETSMPYKAFLMLQFSCILLILLSMLLIFGVIL
jgi:hypothetical protein